MESGFYDRVIFTESRDCLMKEKKKISSNYSMIPSMLISYYILRVLSISMMKRIRSRQILSCRTLQKFQNTGENYTCIHVFYALSNTATCGVESGDKRHLNCCKD